METLNPQGLGVPAHLIAHNDQELLSRHLLAGRLAIACRTGGDTQAVFTTDHPDRVGLLSEWACRMLHQLVRPQGRGPPPVEVRLVAASVQAPPPSPPIGQ